MQSSLNGLFVTKIVSVLLIYNGDNDVTLISFVKPFLWMIFPIQYIEKEKRMSLVQSIQYAVVTIVCIFLKVMTLQIVQEWLLGCLSTEPLPLPYFVSTQYCIFFFIFICCCNSSSDFLVAVIPVVTPGQYEVVPFNNFPFLSASPREFWSKRYNLIVRTFLHSTVFLPLKEQGFSSVFASFASFFVSGLRHVYCAETTFRIGGVSSMCFFIIHALLCMVPGYPKNSSVFVIGISIVLTMLIVLLFAPLYLGLFLSQGPKYLIMNPRKEFFADWVPTFHPPTNMCPVRFS